MLAFHGTPTENLSSILRDGLLPGGPRDPAWYHPSPTPIDPVEASDWKQALTATRFQDHVYLSTTPVSGKGGDPVSFARSWNRRNHHGKNPGVPGCIIVVDCPPAFVQKALSNQDLDRLHEKAYIHNRAPARPLLWIWHFLKNAGWRPGPKCFAEHLELVKIRCDPEFVDPQTPPETWREFTARYRKLMDQPPPPDLAQRRQRLFEQFGLNIPPGENGYDAPYNWDSPFHVVGIYDYGFRFRPVHESPDYPDLPCHFGSYSGDTRYERLIVDNLPFLMNALTGYFEPHSFGEMDDYLERHTLPPDGRLGSREWFRRFPPQLEKLPATWHPEFGTVTDESVFRQKDTQLLCAPIPPERILGAIDIWDGRRFRPHLRPDRKRGQTLEALIWDQVQKLRNAYAGTPVLI